MAPKKDIVYIQHILDAIASIETFLKGISEEDFLGDEPKQDLFIRKIQIIGEASKKISEKIKKEYPKNKKRIP